MMLCILIPLLVGLICAYFGYLLGKNTAEDHSAHSKRIKELEADLEQCRKSKTVSKPIFGNEKMSFANTEASIASAVVFNSDAAKLVFGKKIEIFLNYLIY